MPPATGRRNEILSRSQDTGLIALVVEATRQLLRKEKDEASQLNCFHLDSFDAFISRFVELKVFCFQTFNSLWSLNQNPFAQFFFADKIERSAMKKIRVLALAGALAIVTARCGAVTIAENFSGDPADDGWQVSGNADQFQWDSANQDLDVTWD